MSRTRFTFAIVSLLSLAASAAGDQVPCHCSQAIKKPIHPAPKCGSINKARCEVKLGQQYLDHHLLEDALQHCRAALSLTSSSDDARKCFEDAENSFRKEQNLQIAARLNLINTLIEKGALALAESELRSLRDLSKVETEKVGSVDIVIQNLTEDAEARLMIAKSRVWPASLPTELGIRNWVPGIITQILRFLIYALIVVILWRLLCLVRDLARYLRWSDVSGTIEWQVASIADETKQLGAGAVMDALNVFHNPLFQPLKTSSFLAAPPELADKSGTADPSFLIWRNFLMDSSTLPLTGVRPYISKLIEEIETEKFTRHRFRQVDAFEDINVKLGIIEASLGAVVHNIRRWWTKGWPTVTGSVVIEKVADASFASVRLICNYDLSHWKQKDLAPEDADISPKELFNGERTMAVFASTRQDEFSDAIALASQRAAFRLLYRLAKRPAEPNLAITASSYRQGLRLLLSSL